MSSPKFFAKFRRNHPKDKGPESPPKSLGDELDGPPPSSYSSSLSSTVNSGGGLSSTPPNGCFSGDGSASPLSISPSTPRKDWEVNYKSYLSHISDEKGGIDSSDTSDASKHQHQTDLPYLPQSQSLPKHHFNDEPHRPRFRNSPPTHTAAEVKAATLDSSVHGGNFFKSMFKGGKKGNGVTRHRSGDNGQNGMRTVHAHNQSLDNSMKKNVSCGTLDGTVRGGVSVQVRNRIQSDGNENDPNLRTRQVKSGFFGQRSIVIGPRNGSKKEINGKGNKRRQQKLAFTEIHNDSKDSAAAYLGEEKSVVRGNHFATLRQKEPRRNSLAAVSEEAKSQNLILTPIEGPERWDDGRRYLVAPAILAMSPDSVFTLLGQDEKNRFHLSSNGHCNRISDKILLGEAKVAQISVKGLTEEEYEWSNGLFVLRQNYLLEYRNGDNTDARPRSFAFLQNSSVRRHETFDDAIRLDYYQNYSSSVPRKSVLIRLNSANEKEHWLNCLTEATRLRIEDLYEYDKSAEVLGRGRFATIYVGRRRRAKHSIQPNHQENMNHSNGILKKKPSFTSLLNHDFPIAREDCDSAIKIIDKDQFWERVRKGKERADSLVRETAVQAALLGNQNIYPGFLRVKSFFETLDKVVLELELLEGIDLFRYVSSKGVLNEVESANMMYDILSSIDAMKKIGIAHRDIKPANILMASEEGKGVRVKLGDFGMATFVGHDGLVRGRCGTPGYVAPEIMAAGVNGGYENNVDMFSAGVIMYILLCGYEPFYGESEEELISENKRGKIDYPHDDWHEISVEGRDLVEKMLQKDPSKRIDPNKALQHPWIKRRVKIDEKVQDIVAQRNTKSQSDFVCAIS